MAWTKENLLNLGVARLPATRPVVGWSVGSGRRNGEMNPDPVLTYSASVTDEGALAAVKQASGQLRVEIEALLSMGLPNSPMANADIRVASGNFVTARPRGVLDGVDMCYTGEVRKVDKEAGKVTLRVMGPCFGCATCTATGAAGS